MGRRDDGLFQEISELLLQRQVAREVLHVLGNPRLQEMQNAKIIDQQQSLAVL